MKQLRDSGILIGLMGIATALAACPASLDDRCTDGACIPGGNTGDGGSSDGRDADAPDAVAPDDCNEKADASSPEAKGCIVDSFALFVDGATGDDTNDGTKAKPFKTISAAIAKVPSAGKRRIYVCGEGPYAEHVKVTTAANVFGGFSCSSWAPDPGIKTKVAPTDTGYALHVDGVTAAVRFEDIGFESVPGTDASPSSIAAFVASSPNVTLKRVELKASAGFTSAPGNSGTMGQPNQDPNGNNGSATAGGDAKTCSCSFGSSTTGGRGGNTQGTDMGGESGKPSIAPPVPSTATGAGSPRAECEGGTGNGKRGSDAPAAAFAARPAVGSLDSTGWHPGDGAKGTNGVPGQGGGGGGSYTIGAAGQNGGGGGGACGGCGGGGGDGGKGGGASIALLAFSSPVTLKASTLSAALAGNGAQGRDGGAGASGGTRGNGGNSACAGGNGGNGGKGGAGAGGAGGVSAAILHKGGAPLNEGSSLKHGAKGAFGEGGKSPENDGPDGLEGESVEAP